MRISNDPQRLTDLSRFSKGLGVEVQAYLSGAELKAGGTGQRAFRRLVHKEFKALSSGDDCAFAIDSQ